MEGERLGGAEYTAITKDGTTFPIIINSSPMYQDNKLVGMRGIIIDISEQKRVENALRESEEKFRLLSEQSLLGIVIVQDGFVKYTNQAAADISGNSIKDMLNWSNEEYFYHIHPEDRAFVVEQARKKQRGDPDVVIHYSYRALTKTGELKWIDQYSKSIEYEGGIADLVTIIDITEQKRAENALQQSEELYRLFVQTFPGIAIQLDTNFTPIFVHGAVEQITGYTTDDFMTGKIIWGDTIHRNDRPRIDKSAAVVQQISNTTTDLEYRIFRKDGEIRWIQETLQSIGNESETPRWIQGIIYDITERKQTEEALRESENKYSTLVEHARDGVVIIQDDQIKFANRAVVEITGYSLEETIDTLFWERIFPESREVLAQSLKPYHNGETTPPPIYETKISCKNGVIKDIEVSAARINYQGRPATMAIIRDITARRQQEEFRRDLEEKRLGFMEMTSHELRTPLTVIRGFSELLASRFEDFDQKSREKYFEILNRNIRRLERLVQSVSTLRQIDRGVFSLHKQTIDFVQFLDEALEPYKAVLGADLCISRIVLHQQGQKHTCIEVDPDKLNQVLDNLLDNAIKHTKAPRQIRVTPEALSDRIRISIKDNGAGIDSKNIDQIFEPFVSIPTIYATGGTGIGLYLAKKIIEAHGGDLTVQSEGKGFGATFIVSIPRKEN
jgi:PAS domain S-box-containing protein